MGNKCCRGTPYNIYAKYLSPADPVALKQSWPLIKIFKLKQAFNAKSLQSQQSEERYISFNAFSQMFPEFNQEKFNAYTQAQRRRLFDLFDCQGDGKLAWPDFFSGLTLCYYGPQENLAALLFALYDQKLKLVIPKSQIEDLLSSNSRYLAEKGEDISEGGFEFGFAEIGIDQWMKQSRQWIDYGKLRKLFGVFPQEQLEKELGQSFSELNELYNSSKGKFVGYLVNRKWFQSWRIFLQKEYDIELSGYGKFQTYAKTNKSIKTKKTLKSIKSCKTINSGNSNKKKLIEAPRLKQLLLPPDLKVHTTNFNLIHSNIGDRPTQIRNNTLEGEFSEILAPGLVENVDYVILSEAVWSKLKIIYGAYPEFRRSGDSAIEIYPKTLKIYKEVRQGLIDYEQQKICEFSSMMQFQYLLKKALESDQEQSAELNSYTFFVKNFSASHWEPIEDLSCKVAEISAELLIFLAVVPKEDASLFKSRYGHPTTDINHLHIGDECLYYECDSLPGRKALIVSQTKSKVVLHFKGSSYINDLCIDRDIFRKRVVLAKKDGIKKLRMEEHELSGISDGRGLDFINSMLLVLLSNESLVKFLLQYAHFEQKASNLVHYLALIYKMLSSGSAPKSILIADFTRIYFQNYFHFELSMAEEFLAELFQKISYQFYKQGCNAIEEYRVETESFGICSSCGQRKIRSSKYFFLTLPVAEEEVQYYEVIFVPYAYTINYTQRIKVAFALPRKSTFEQYKRAFENAAELKGVVYALVQIQGHDIIKNYSNAFPEATLEQLMLREEDSVYAFELCVKIDSFISDHYTLDPMVKPRSLKQGQMIDFLKKSTAIADITSNRLKSEEQEEKRWSFGKIVNIQNERYTHKLALRVEYREKRGEVLQVQLSPESQAVAPFPTKSFKFAEQFHIKCIQRVFNEVSNEMELVSLPFVLMVGQWMRLREVELLVYQQLQDQIELAGRFRLDQSQSAKIGKKEKIRKFKEYLSKHKPYALRFTDLEGRCAFCYKLQKQRVFPNEDEFICQGNQDLDAEEPIFWTLKPYQIRICIDWKSPFDFCLPEPAEHLSVPQSYSARKESVQNLYSCLEQRFKSAESEQCSECNEQDGIQTWQQNLVNSPERLAFVLERVSQPSKKINRKPVAFELQEMVIGTGVYTLAAAVALNQPQSVHQYLVYLKDKHRWLQYQGESVKLVKKAAVQRACALLLFYNKIGAREKPQKK